MFGFFKNKEKNKLLTGRVYRHIGDNEEYQLLDFSPTIDGLCYIQNTRTLEVGRCLVGSLDDGVLKKGDIVVRDYLKISPVYKVSRIDGDKVFCSHNSNTKEYCFYSHNLRKATKKEIALANAELNK